MKRVHEVTIQFLLVNTTTWIAYLEDKPAINYQADNIKMALTGLFATLRMLVTGLNPTGSKLIVNTRFAFPVPPCLSNPAGLTTYPERILLKI